MNWVVGFFTLKIDETQMENMEIFIRYEFNSGLNDAIFDNFEIVTFVSLDNEPENSNWMVY